METILEAMLEQQRLDNLKFATMEVVVEQPEVGTIICDNPYKEIVSPTELVEVEDIIVLKRFINNKLYKVEFCARVFTIRDYIKWKNLGDTIFKQCSR